MTTNLLFDQALLTTQASFVDFSNLCNKNMELLHAHPVHQPKYITKLHDKIQTIAKNYASRGMEIRAINPDSGPRSIESIYDKLLSSPGTLKAALNNLDFDGFVIACYSNHPTMYALRDVTDKPVLGIAEASMYVACMLGHKFSVVTTNCEWEPLLWDAVKNYGMAERCASVRSTGMPVLALESAKLEERYHR